jgi:hypothetical protein
MQNRVRLVKAFDIRRIKPRALVLGTSRSHVAIRTTHPGWNPPAEPRYNAAFDGATTHEMYAYLRHARAIEPLRQVVLGLDTWQLDSSPSGVRPGFEPGILDVPGDPWHGILSRLSAMRVAFSAGAVLASFQTVLSQDNAQEDWFAPDGQRLGEVFFHRPDEDYVTEGQRSYFLAIDRQEAGFKLDSGNERPRRSAGDEKPDLSSLGYVHLMIEFCRAEGIDLRIFITPAHAHQMEIAAAVGEWPKIEAGKRELVRLLANDAALHPGAKPFIFFDFSGYSSVTMEPLPQSGSSEEMTYYWDSSHFKEEVGDWVLDRLFAVQQAGHPVPGDFGIALTAETIDAALAEIRAGRARYRAGHPADATQIRIMAEEVWHSLPPNRRTPLIGAE